VTHNSRVVGTRCRTSYFRACFDRVQAPLRHYGGPSTDVSSGSGASTGATATPTGSTGAGRTAGPGAERGTGNLNGDASWTSLTGSIPEAVGRASASASASASAACHPRAVSAPKAGRPPTAPKPRRALSPVTTSGGLAAPATATDAPLAPREGPDSSLHSGLVTPVGPAAKPRALAGGKIQRAATPTGHHSSVGSSASGPGGVSRGGHGTAAPVAGDAVPQASELEPEPPASVLRPRRASATGVNYAEVSITSKLRKVGAVTVTQPSEPWDGDASDASPEGKPSCSLAGCLHC
jgi:hypothetical protein